MKETLSWGYLESTAIQLQLHSMLMDENVLNEHRAFVINRSIGKIRILA